MNEQTDETDITIADLYPDLTPEQQEEAEYYLTRYLDLVRRIYERNLNLTESGDEPTMPMS